MMQSKKQKKNWQRKSSPLFTLALLLSVVAAPRASAAPLAPRSLQTTTTIATFTMPSSVANGTAVKIDGSNAMAGINQTLKQAFEQKFAGTTVNTAQSGTDTALQAVLNGQIDLAAIGRPLTADEKAKGLVEVPVARNKIAIIVGANNPFRGTLTLDQFAKIYQGEITDWSQVEPGAAGAIRPIDRPATSDTRQAFGRYPSFANGLQSGASIAKVEQDSTQAIIDQLGNDGISYAIAPQLTNQPNARAISMYGTMPDDPRYPFSQPLMYVYKGPTPTPQVSAFLGFATAAENQQAVEMAKAGDGTANAAAQKPADSGNPLSAIFAAFTSNSNNSNSTNANNSANPASNAAGTANSEATNPAATGTAPAVTAQANNSQNAINAPAPGGTGAGTAPAGTNPGANPAANAGANATGTTTALVPAPEAAAPETGGFPKWLWWLLPLGLGAVILGWLFKDRSAEDEWQTVEGDLEGSFDRRPGLEANDDPGYTANLERDIRLDADTEPNGNFVSDVAESASGTVRRVADAASNTADGAIDAVSNAAGNTADAGKAAWAGGAAAAAGAGAAMMGGLGALIGGNRAESDDRDPTLAAAVPETPEVAPTSGRADGHGFLGKIGDSVSKFVDGAKQKASDVAIGVSDTAGNVVEGAGNAVDGAGQGISTIASGVTGAATDAVDGAANVAGRIGNTVSHGAGDVAQGAGHVVSGVTDTVGNLAQGAGKATSQAAQGAGDVVSHVTDAAGNAIQGTAQGANQLANTAANAVTGASGNVFAGSTNVFEQAVNAAASPANTANTVANNIASNVANNTETATSDEVIWFESSDQG